MIVSDITELDVYGVLDRGIPNQERIALYVKFPLNIGKYGLMIGIKANGEGAIPLKDQLFWFGDGFLNPGDWIFIYTGAGEAKASELPDGNSKLYSAHWGKPKTVFGPSEVVPILFRVDAAIVHQETKQLEGTQQ